MNNLGVAMQRGERDISRDRWIKGRNCTSIRQTENRLPFRTSAEWNAQAAYSIQTNEIARFRAQLRLGFAYQ